MSRTTLRSLAVLVLVAGASLPSLPKTAHATPANVDGAFAWGDFDGDGDIDRAASSPEADCNKGSVYVADSSGSVVRWTRDTSGVLGTAACDDYFGASLAVGDFNGDTYDDLLIGVPGADDSGVSGCGVAQILYGSSSGLTATGDQLWHQDSSGISGACEADDQFAEVVGAGDFNCDGYDDAVIAAPAEGISSAEDAGAVHVLYGSSGGVTSTDDLYYQGNAGVDGAPETSDRFGDALAAGNFNGDTSSSRPCEDLAIGAPAEDIGSVVDAGFVYTLLGGTAGLSTTGDFGASQDTSGVVDTAQTSDRFAHRLYVGDENGDGYDDLAVVVPGDSCVTGHGLGKHVFRGTSTGLTATDDRLDCDLFRCNVIEADDTYACPSTASAVFASSSADTIGMFFGDDIVFAGAGWDGVTLLHGNDVLFAGSGADFIEPGPGKDLVFGGSGNDTIEIDQDCAALSGKVLDGGPGTDTIRSHLTGSQLVAAGVTVSSIESYVTIAESSAGCETPPYEEGPMRPPRVTLAWSALPEPDSVVTTTTGSLVLALSNSSAVSVTVALEFRLGVQGYVTEKAPTAITIGANANTTYTLSLSSFIPSGVDPGDVDPDLLDLPTSAILTTRARLTVSGVAREHAFAPTLYGHLEGGDTAVVYRWDAYHATYRSGDLRAWRTSTTPAYAGPAKLMGVVEAKVVPPP